MKAAVKELIVVGNLIYTKVTCRHNKGPKGKRKTKSNPTSEDVKRINQVNAEKDLSIKLHHNFNPGDIHAVLTYSGEEPTKEQALKELNKFKRKVSKLYKEKGISPKWIEVTEYKNKRIHHHMILPYIDLLELKKIWPCGFLRPSFLDETKDWRKLVAYLIKESSKTFREDDAYAKRRYRCSRSIETPTAKVEEVSIKQLFDPKAVKGYYIDQDSIFKGTNPGTDKPYIDYVQVATDAPITKYKRGRNKKYKKERFIRPATIEEEQQSLNL